MNLAVTPARLADIRELAATMREADRAEVLASSGLEPEAALVKSVDASVVAYAAKFDGELAAIFGIAYPHGQSVLGPRSAVAWMLTSTVVDRKPKSFMRACRMVVGDLVKVWGTLTNAIDARHEKALRWARRLGFEVRDPEPFGVAGLPFCTFYAREASCVSQ